MKTTKTPSLDGKTFLITGVSSDIGIAICDYIVSSKGKIVLGGRNRESLYALKDRYGASAVACTVFDFTDPVGIRDAFSALGDHFPLAGMVYVAGLHFIKPAHLTTSQDVMEAFTVNTASAIELARLMSKPRCFDPEGSSIVFLSSIAANRAERGLLAYAVAKGALKVAAANLSLELAAKNIRVNVLELGWIQTSAAERTTSKMSPERYAAAVSEYPLGLGTPDDVAQATLFLLGPESRWITGATIPVDGGRTA